MTAKTDSGRAGLAGLPDIDWTATPLGAPETWPTELRTAAGIVLASRFPMALIWGEQRITLHNEAFRPILGRKPDAQGRSFAQIWAEAWGEIGPIMDRAFAGEATFIEDFPLVVERHGHAEQANFTFCYSPVFGPEGSVCGVIDTVVETTSLVRGIARSNTLVALGDRLRDARSEVEATALAAELVGDALGAMRAGYARIDERAGQSTVDTGWAQPGAAPLSGTRNLDGYAATLAEARHGETLVVADVETDGRFAADLPAYRAIGTRAQIEVPLIEHGTLVGVFYVHNEQPRTWDRDDVTLVRAVADRLHTTLARLHAEAEQELLNRELDHRLKNMMSLVQAIAHQTLRGASEADAYAAFEQRIAALARAHELLVQRSGASTSIRSVVDTMRALHGGNGRFVVSGEDMELGPKGSLSLALILHELATNATKYGALSVPEGRVHLDWTLEAVDGEPTLRLRWREAGGPPVIEPAHKGFGSRLIRLGLANTRDVDKRYEPDGLRADFRAPLALLQEA